MRIGPEDPVFARLPLYLIRKYYFDNHIARFFLYTDRDRIVCAAPEEGTAARQTTPGKTDRFSAQHEHPRADPDT
jgi:hypothetical protein